MLLSKKCEHHVLKRTITHIFSTLCEISIVHLPIPTIANLAAGGQQTQRGDPRLRLGFRLRHCAYARYIDRTLA